MNRSAMSTLLDVPRAETTGERQDRSGSRHDAIVAGAHKFADILAEQLPDSPLRDAAVEWLAAATRDACAALGDAVEQPVEKAPVVATDREPVTPATEGDTE